MDRYECALKELDSYLELEERWDSYDGETFSIETINRAKEMVAKIKLFFNEHNLIPNELYPGPASDGSVDIEVEYEKKCLFITIYPCEFFLNFCLIISNIESETWDFSKDSNIEDINKKMFILLEKLIGN